MLKVFAAAIFLSAALLFLVQPMAGKVLLPILGGSPAVWNTCMVFFQAILLLGYLYAHAVTTRLSVRAQACVHAVLVVLAAAFLLHLNLAPGSILHHLTGSGEAPDLQGQDPTLWLIRTLLILVGLPFFVVSTSGPLLQKWFSGTSHPQARDPYFLYAASNAGSLLGLLAYPFLVEPALSRVAQHHLWGAGFVLFMPLIGACALFSLRHPGTPKPAEARRADLLTHPVTAGRRLRWIALAFIPSSLMLGVTQHISTDIAAIPLLWVVPLAIYLVSFIWAFSPALALKARTWGRALPFGVLAVIVAMLAGAQHPVLLITGLHLAVFFLVAMMCHTALAEDRPATEHLTEFYLLMSVGGVLGGSFNALLAPVIFNSIAEYPLVIGLSCLLRPQLREEWALLPTRARRLLSLAIACVLGVALFALVLNIDAAASRGILNQLSSDDPKDINRTRQALVAGLPALLVAIALVRRGSLRFAACAIGALLVSTIVSVGSGVIESERTFFGVHYVGADRQNTRRLLRHGTTLHGIQLRSDFELGDKTPYPDADFRYKLLHVRGTNAITRDERLKWLHLVPTTYYHPTGPIGEVMKELTDSNRLDQVALIGLGTGSLLAYARPNSSFHLYEIDPAVIRIARTRDYFSYISDALKDPTVTVASPATPGDGRLDIARAPEGAYSLIVIDAFSSDAIPVHLITKEAVETYLRALKPNGVIAFHVSSRYFSLSPVLARIAGDLGLEARARLDSVVISEDAKEAKRQSDWVVLARNDDALGGLARNSNWQRLTPRASDPLWSDDYSNLLGVFRGWGLPQQ